MFSPQHGAPAPAVGARKYAQTHAISSAIGRCWPSADLTAARGGGLYDMKKLMFPGANVFNTSWFLPIKCVIPCTFLAVYHTHFSQK